MVFNIISKTVHFMSNLHPTLYISYIVSPDTCFIPVIQFPVILWHIKCKNISLQASAQNGSGYTLVKSLSNILVKYVLDRTTIGSQETQGREWETGWTEIWSGSNWGRWARPGKQCHLLIVQSAPALFFVSFAHSGGISLPSRRVYLTSCMLLLPDTRFAQHWGMFCKYCDACLFNIQINCSSYDQVMWVFFNPMWQHLNRIKLHYTILNAFVIYMSYY